MSDQFSTDGKSRVRTEAYSRGYDRIFGRKKANGRKKALKEEDKDTFIDTLITECDEKDVVIENLMSLLDTYHICTICKFNMQDDYDYTECEPSCIFMNDCQARDYHCFELESKRCLK